MWLSVLPLLLLAGGARAASVLFAGREAVYDYNTTIATGFHTFGSQFSVFTLQGTVKAAFQSEQEATFLLQDVKVGEKNDQLPSLNLRTLQMPTQKNEGYEKFLKLPFSAQFQNGKVSKVFFQADDPIWSKDLKKGMIDMFQLSKDENPGRYPPNDVPGRGQQHQAAKFWTSTELTVNGKCEVRTVEESLPYPGNPSAKVVNITRHVNTENANRTAKFFFTDHPPFRCTDCDGDRAYPLTHNVITRLNIEVQSDKYVVQEIYRDGIIKLSLMGARAENIHSFYNQWLVLRQIGPSRSVPKLSNSREESIVSELQGNMELAYSPSVKPPSQQAISNITATVKSLLNEIVEAVVQRLDTEKAKIILSHEILIQKAFRSLPQTALAQIVEEALRSGSEKDAIKQKVVLDMLARTGTKDAIEIIMKLIQEKKVKEEERIIALMQNIPANIVLPDLKVADSILNFCGKLRQSSSSSVLKACYFSFAELVGRTCTKYNSTHTIRPAPTEKRCPKDQAKAFVSHIKRFMEQAKDAGNEEMESAYAAALGLMNVQSSIFALEARALGEGINSEIVQRVAIHALSQLGKMYPEDVRRIMRAILYNSQENSENRIAAIVVLISSRPPQGTFDEMAAYTWVVKDQKVGAFIVSTLRALANVTVPCIKNLANFAKHALQVANKQKADSVFMGYRKIVDKMISYLELGYAGHFEFVGDGGGFIPSAWHMKWQSYAAGFFNNIFQLSGNAVSLSDIFDKLWGPAYMHRPETAQQILNNIYRNIPDQGLDYINQKLGIKPRTRQGKVVLQMVLRVLHHKYSQYYMNATEIARIFEREFPLKNSVDITDKFDVIRFLMPMDIRYVFPSAAGHHLHLNIKLPVVAGVRGTYSVKGALGSSGGEGKINIKISAEPILEGKLHVKFGPVLPCSASSSNCHEMTTRVPDSPTWGVHYGAGFETIILFKPTASAMIEATFDRRNKNVKFVLTPIPSSTPKHDFVYYKMKPFTTIYLRTSLAPITGFEKVVYIRDNPFKFEYELDVTAAGDLKFSGNHEDEWLDQADILSAVWKRGVAGIVNFAPLTQRLRYREFHVQVLPKWNLPKYTANVFWDYTPAESDPKPQPKNTRQFVWSGLSGWFETPEECSDSKSQGRIAFMDSRFLTAYDSYRTSTEYPSSSSDGYSRSSEESDWFSRRRSSGERSRESFSEESFGGAGSAGSQGGPGHQLKDQIVPLGKGTAILRLSGSLEMKGGKEITYIFNSTMKSERETLIRNYEATLIKQGSEGTFASSVKGTYKVPRRPCHFRPQLASAAGENQQITVNAEFKWGSSQSSMNNTIRVQGIARKSSAQQKLESRSPKDKNKPWYYARCEIEQSRGFLNHAACQRVMDHKSELHHIQADLDFSQAYFSPLAKKVLVNAERWIMHSLYRNMNEDIENRGPPGRATIIARFNDTMPVLDVQIKTPVQNTKYVDVYYGEVLPGFASPSTRKSQMHRLQEYTTNYQSPTACLLSGSYLTTFNNITWSLKGVNDCPYLVAKDCSTGNSFYVLLKHNEKNTDTDKTLVVGVLKHNITIVPRGAGSQKDVFVDGQAKQIPDKHIDYLRDPECQDNIIAYVSKAVPHYNVYLPYLGIRVKFDGNNVKIQASHLWRDKLCGLCGEFRGRKQYNRIGPDQCAYARDQDLVSQYVVRESGCSASPRSASKLCGLNSTLAVSASLRDPCLLNRHYRSRVGRTVCYTKDIHPQCTAVCEPTEEEEKEVPAKCFKIGDENLAAVESQVNLGPVEYLQTATANSRVKINVPKSCSPRRRA